MATPLDHHLATLGGASPRSSNPRHSAGRDSISSSTSQLQNVTTSLDLQRISTEISDTENTIRALELEIQNLERQRKRNPNGSNYGDDLEDETEDDFYSRAFIRHSRPRTYKPYFTLFFLIFCIIMFIAEIGLNNWTIESLSFNPLIGPSVEVLLKLGAKETELLQEGQVYRLFAPMVLHVGVVHLLANMLGLIAIGIPMEQEFGSIRITIIAIASGVFGIVVSALLAPNVVGVGASGMIFGLFGAAWADLIQNWHTYRGKNTLILAQLTLYTLINFFFGLMPFLDNFAHLGGFSVGLITGMALLVKTYGEHEFRMSYTVKVILRVLSAIALPIIIGAMLFLLFLGFDVSGKCEWCSYLSCVPFPPNADTSHLWWDCTPCTNGFGEFANFTEGESVVIICPDGEEKLFGLNTDIDEDEFQKRFVTYCGLACEGGSVDE